MAQPLAGQLSLMTAVRSTPRGTAQLAVLIPCSKWKAPSPEVATAEELDGRREEVLARLGHLALPARGLYAGRAYRHSITAIERFEDIRPDLPLQLKIASAGYGIVDAEDLLVPYEATMGMNSREWSARGKRLGMPSATQALIESTPLTLIALSQPYATGCSLATLEPTHGRAFVIGAGRASPSTRIQAVAAGRREARALGTTEREVASKVLASLLDLIARHGLEVVRDLPPDPLSWKAA